MTLQMYFIFALQIPCPVGTDSSHTRSCVGQVPLLQDSFWRSSLLGKSRLRISQLRQKPHLRAQLTCGNTRSLQAPLLPHEAGQRRHDLTTGQQQPRRVRGRRQQPAGGAQHPREKSSCRDGSLSGYREPEGGRLPPALRLGGPAGAAGGGAATPQVWRRLRLRCGRPRAAPLPRHGGPRRAGPLRGRLLAGAGLRRAGLGGAAGRGVRRRVLRRPAHLRGRHRHLPQPHLVGVLVRGQPGGASGGAARRRGAGAAQGPRGQRAAGAGARPQPPPVLGLRLRAEDPSRRHRRPGAEGPAGPPRRAQQGLLKP